MTTAQQERLEQRLLRYASLQTVSTDVTTNTQALVMLQNELQTLGMFTQINGQKHPWLIATTRGNTKHVGVLLHAHFDVVPASHPDQFDITIDDSRIIGRGVFDMKFAVAAYMEALEQLGGMQAYDLGVLITTDEELGGQNGVKEFLEQGWTCGVAIIPDGGRDLKIERRAKGFVYGFLEANGTSAHGSRPWEADNPIPKLIPALEEIVEHFANADPTQPTAVITGIDTPSALTQIPHLARARIDVRAFEQADIKKIVVFLKDLAARHGLTYEQQLSGEPVHLQDQNALVQQFIACQTEVLGRPAEFTESLGASDARYFAEHNIPTVVEYPHGGNAHGAEEWIGRKSFATFYEIMALFIRRAAQAPDLPLAKDAFAAPKRLLRFFKKDIPHI